MSLFRVFLFLFYLVLSDCHVGMFLLVRWRDEESGFIELC